MAWRRCSGRSSARGLGCGAEKTHPQPPRAPLTGRPWPRRRGWRCRRRPWGYSCVVARGTPLYITGGMKQQTNLRESGSIGRGEHSPERPLDDGTERGGREACVEPPPQRTCTWWLAGCPWTAWSPCTCLRQVSGGAAVAVRCAPSGRTRLQATHPQGAFVPGPGVWRCERALCTSRVPVPNLVLVPDILRESQFCSAQVA